MMATALDVEAQGEDRDSGAGIVMADRTVNGLQPPIGGAASFYSLSPCRVIDTRNPAALRAGPALRAGAERAFSMAGVCGIPTTAKAVSANVTVTGTTAAGNLRFFPVGVGIPLVSTINFAPGQTRANDAIIQIGGGTTGSITVRNDASGTVHLILDVNGYFQ
jgi:hypothetical protein